MAKRKIDPKPKITEVKPRYSEGKSGPKATITRDSKGKLKAIIPKNFAGITQETLRQDRMTKAGTGSGSYDGGPAPRVGGKQKLIKSGPLKSATKKVIKQSKRKPTGSVQAKASQKRNNKF